MMMRRLLIVPLLVALACAAGCQAHVDTVTVGTPPKAKQASSQYAIKYVEGDRLRSLYVIEDRNKGKAHLVFVIRYWGYEGVAATKLDEWTIGDKAKSAPRAEATP